MFSGNESQIKIAMLRIGGIGDALNLSAQATAVKRKYPDAHITLFVRDMDCKEVVDGHLAVDHVVVIGRVKWEDGLSIIRQKNFDIVYDNRYVTKVYYKDEAQFAEDKRQTDEAFKPYKDLYEGFPLTNNQAGKTGKSSIELMLETAVLVGGEGDLAISLSFADCNMAKLLYQEKYITIHNGADVGRQTKCWSTKKWNEFSKWLCEKGYKVIQLGRRQEEPVDSTTDMRGRTSIKEAAALIGGARLHIDTEGGLVHIARAVKTRSIVLFGPTPVKFFGYKCNVNLMGESDCKECWWESDIWWRECPKGYPAPAKCMESITPYTVAKAVEQAETMPPLEGGFNPVDYNEEFAMELALDGDHYRGEAHQWDRIYTMMAKVRGKKVLEVGAGDGYCVEVLKKQGYEVSATEVSQVRLDRMKRRGIDAVYGDVNGLPYPDNYFDSVICGEVLEHIDSMAKGLSELERVCKKDGIIIISLPVSPEMRQIKMHKWGIGHHEILREGKISMVVLTLERINRDETGSDNRQG